MKRRAACAAVGVGILAACSSSGVRYKAPAASWLVGAWEGTVTLSEGPAIREGPVSFNFRDGEYRVQGSKSLAPPGCGTYQLGSLLILDDTCLHTAEFDWTLILKGGFSYRWDGETLTLDQDDTAHGRRRHIVLRRATNASPE